VELSNAAKKIKPGANVLKNQAWEAEKMGGSCSAAARESEKGGLASESTRQDAE